MDKQKEDWEKEFATIFTDLAKGYSHHGVELKSFICQTRQEAVREVLEEIEEKLLLAGNISGGDNIDIIEGIISQLKQKYLKEEK